jgi:DNA-binding SARP family transcriptional activator/tetratricopeptide (TPR) repeat protein
MATMEFRLLGLLEVRRGGVPLPVPPGKPRVLLAALLLRAGRVVPLDELSGALWGPAPPTSELTTIRNYVNRLRGALEDTGRTLISTQPRGYLIAVADGELDVARFEARLAAARAAADSRSWADAAAAARAALALWRDEPLADIQSDLLALREVPRLAELRMQALETRLGADLELGQHAGVIPELRQLCQASPLRERLHATLMTALYRDGQRAAALAAYQAVRDVLIHELGTEPGPELQLLHQQVLADDPALRSGRPGAVPIGTGPAPGTAGPQAATVRSWLPPDTAAFTGREQELGEIAAAVTDAVEACGVVAIRAIGGMPGVGKTALAVHAAHLLRDRFPDQQLHIDLHAHTPGQDPVPPAAALARLLASAGVDPRSLPGDLEGRAALWRDKMAGQRAVLLLDNAASSAQVAPLLPGGAGCLVLVTSRRHLGDLPGTVVPILLETLPAARAREMFLRLAPRAAGAPDAAVTELLGLTGFLPLAISLLARLHARHPAWTLADLAAETRASLLTLAAENDSVAAAFEVSYRYLPAGQQRFFRALGLHPGTTTDAYAAAALAGLSRREAAGYLDDLHGEGLLTETGYRRYGMHDLIRRYARDLAAADPAADRDRALDRLLDYYQHTASLAQALLGRQSPADPAPAALASPPAAVPDLPDYATALAWARAERADLLACLDHVTMAGRQDRVAALTAASAALLQHDGPWADAVSRHGIAAAAARLLGDEHGQASALNHLAVARRLTGDYPGAIQSFREALSLYRGLASRLGQANVLCNLAAVHVSTDEYPGATSALTEALEIYRDLGDLLGQANALSSLADVLRPTGDYPAATRVLTEALGIYRDLGDLLGQADALSSLADVRRLTDDYPEAARHLEAALDIYGAAGNRLGQADALFSLGAVRQQTGDYPAATRVLAEALGIQREIGNRRGQANALNELAYVRRLTGNYAVAIRDAAEGLRIYRDLGDRLGQANALIMLGILRRLTGEYPDAARALEASLDICHESGYRLGRAFASCELAAVRRLTGDYPAAAEALAEALNIYRDIGARAGEAEALNEAGTQHLARGDLGPARASYRQALALARQIASSRDEAHALAGLGRCAVAAGRPADALRQAHEIYQEIGAPEAAAVAAELDALAGADPSAGVPSS